MLVKYAKPNLHHVHFAFKETLVDEDGVPILDANGKESKVARVGEITLIPGYNEVDDTAWERAGNHPAVKAMLEEEVLVAVNAKGTSSMAESQAIAMVGKTVDEALLQKWRATERKRPKVQKAIDAQLDKIDPEKDKKKADDE